MKTYLVKEGDTLGEIAEAYNVSVEHLLSQNLGIKDPDIIKVGMIIFVGNELLHTVVEGESLSQIGAFYRVPWRDIADFNGIDDPDLIHVGQRLYIPGEIATGFHPVWPTDYKTITQRYGANPDWAAYRRLGGHEGTDIRARYGTPIYAIERGTVTSTGNHPAYGNYVRIQHPEGFSAVYAHASELLVKRGDIVTRGQEIMKAGSTGNSSGPHLHLTLMKNKERVNPEEYLPLDGVDYL